MATQNNFLEVPLQSLSLGADIKAHLTSCLWDYNIDSSNTNDSDRLADLSRYFLYYIEQVTSALHDNGRFVSVKKHADIGRIAGFLKQDLSREEILLRLRSHNPSGLVTGLEEFLNTSIDLAARLLLMVKIGQAQAGFSGYKPLIWENGCLRSFVTQTFSTTLVHDRGEGRLEKLFIGINLKRIARIKIVWTDNLADHLRMLDDDKKVAIFHHAAFLDAVRNSSLFPDGLVDETIRSLALLFPQSDNKTKIWYKRRALKHALDSKAIECGHLRAEDRHISAFSFWRDRIVILKQVFDEAEPNSWSQWWYDRRKGSQRYPFLIAAVALVLTALFGLIQCFEGALQVYKAYYPSEVPQ